MGFNPIFQQNQRVLILLYVNSHQTVANLMYCGTSLIGNVPHLMGITSKISYVILTRLQRSYGKNFVAAVFPPRWLWHFEYFNLALLP